MAKPIVSDFAALVAFVDARHSMPHEWGRKANDCMSFVGQAVEALTNGAVKPLAGLQWKSQATGISLLRRLGGVEKALDARFERIAPAMAQRGDIAGVPDEALGIHPMIVEGVTLVGPSDNGNRRLPRSAMTVAWSSTKPRKKTKAS